MVCLPKGSFLKNRPSEAWPAFSFFDKPVTLFNDHCQYLSFQMHEFGHYLGLGHSTYDLLEYGDETGYMGQSYTEIRSPKKCFNGPMSWQLGWYNDRLIQIGIVDHSWRYEFILFGIPYYDVTNSENKMIIKIDNLFVTFNSQYGMNKDTKNGNRVLIHFQNQDGSSRLIHVLDKNEFAKIPSSNVFVRIHDVDVDPSNKAAKIEIIFEYDNWVNCG